MSKEMKKAGNLFKLAGIDTVEASIPKLDGERWVRVNRDAYPLLKPVYWVSSKGRVYNDSTQHMMKIRHLDPKKHSSPYSKVNLQIELAGRSYGKACMVHRMMMTSFYPRKNMNKLTVNHIDGNKLNNDLSNLEWVLYRKTLNMHTRWD